MLVSRGAPSLGLTSRLALLVFTPDLIEFCFNSRGATLMPLLSVKHLLRDPSDHSLLLLSCSSPHTHSSRFVFQQMWTEDTSFKPLVQTTWESFHIPHPNPFFVLQGKLRALQDVLQHWKKEHFGNIFDGISKVEVR